MAELRIKEICKQKGITQQELASKLGIAQPSISNRLINPTFQSMEEIAKALEVPVTELIKDEDATAKLTCPHCGQPIEIHIK